VQVLTVVVQVIKSIILIAGYQLPNVIGLFVVKSIYFSTTSKVTTFFTCAFWLLFSAKMGRHKPWVELSPCQTICIRNAKAHINYGIKTVYYENESSFETIRPPSEQTRRKKAAYEVLQKWKEPGASVPLGVARYFLQDTKFMLVAEQLGVLDLFKSIQDEHLATCPNHCIALVHPGQFIPDCGSIAMIATTSSSFANFSAVVLTAPVPDEPRTVGEGPSSSFKSSPSSPSLSFSVSEDFNIHRLAYIL
jgi:hypothetical protein